MIPSGPSSATATPMRHLHLTSLDAALRNVRPHQSGGLFLTILQIRADHSTRISTNRQQAGQDKKVITATAGPRVVRRRVTPSMELSVSLGRTELSPRGLPRS